MQARGHQRDEVGEPAGATMRLIGRDLELARLVELIRSGARVINVCGAAGVGKTSLARAAVDTVAVEYDAVQMADVSAPGGWPLRPAEALPGRTLLVLDNAEALVSPSDLRELTENDPDLQVVAITIGHLAPGESVEVCPLARSDAEQLFAGRAADIDPKFHLDPQTTPHVQRICAAVEGLPLALQLAAARLPPLPLPVLAQQLADGRALAVLSGSGADIGMRNCLEASCAHLRVSAATLFARTGAFAGSFDLDALIGVAGGEATSELFDYLSRLVHLHLVEAGRDGSDSVRYRLPALVRELARDRLHASGRHDEVASRHATHFASVARRAAEQMADARDEQALPLLKQDAVDLAAALQWQHRHRPSEALRLAADLALAAEQLGEYERCRAALDLLLLRVGTDVDDATRRDALLSAAALGLMSRTAAADAELTVDRLSEGTALARTSADPLPLLRALSLSVLALPVTEDLAQAALAAKEGIEISRALGHARWRARFEAWTGMIHHLAGEMADAARFGEQALRRALRAEDPRGIVIAGVLLHQLPPEAGADRSQLPSLEELLALAEQLDDVPILSHLSGQLAATALADNDAPAAARWVLRRLELATRAGAWHGAGYVLMQSVRIASLRHDDEVAATLHGAATPMLDVLYGSMAPASAASYQAGIAQVRARLGEGPFDGLSGRAGPLTWDVAIVQARSYLLDVISTTEPASPTAEPVNGPAVHELTPREVQVLGLIVQGQRNKEIAALLHVTPKTVMHHSVAIYRKLGVRGRAEAAVTAVREGLVPAP